MNDYENLLKWWKNFQVCPKADFSASATLEVERFIGFLKVFIETNSVEILSYSGYRDSLQISLKAGGWKMDLEIAGDRLKVKKTMEGEQNISALSGLLLRFVPGK